MAWKTGAWLNKTFYKQCNGGDEKFPMFPPENKHCKDPTGKLNRYLCIEKRIGSSTLWDERPSTGVKYSKGNAA